MTVLVSIDKDKVRNIIQKWQDGGPANDMFQVLKEQLAETDLIDLDKEHWNSIKETAKRSPWIPAEYYQNDWVADVCNFLMTSR